MSCHDSETGVAEQMADKMGLEINLTDIDDVDVNAKLNDGPSSTKNKRNELVPKLNLPGSQAQMAETPQASKKSGRQEFRLETLNEADFDEDHLNVGLVEGDTNLSAHSDLNNKEA